MEYSLAKNGVSCYTETKLIRLKGGSYAPDQIFIPTAFYFRIVFAFLHLFCPSHFGRQCFVGGGFGASCRGEHFVRYTGASSKSWLGVTAEGETEPVRLELDGQASGAVELPCLSAGTYRLSLYRYGTAPAYETTVTVTDSPVYLNTASVGWGGSTELHVRREERKEDAWVGIFPAGAVPGIDPCPTWIYLRDLPESGSVSTSDFQGNVPFALLPKGEYQLILFEDGGYSPEVSWTFQIDTADAPNLFLFVPKNTPKNSVDGTLYITFGTNPSNYYWIAWADDTGVLEDYTPLGMVSSESEQLAFSMPDHAAVPREATRLVLCKGTETPFRSGRSSPPSLWPLYRKRLCCPLPLFPTSMSPRTTPMSITGTIPGWFGM